MYHVLGHLGRKLSKKLLGQQIGIHANFSKRDKLNDISHSPLSSGVVQAVISIQPLHIVEFCISNANNDNGQRQIAILD